MIVIFFKDRASDKKNTDVIDLSTHFNKKDSTSQIVKVKIQNTGIFATKAKLIVEIYDNKGNKIKAFEALAKRIYPDKCNDFEIEIKDLPKGKYDGVIIADNGLDLFGANITLEI